MPARHFLRDLLKQNVVLLLVAMLMLVSLLGPVTHGNAGRSLRHVLFHSVGLLLLVIILARVEIRGGFQRLRYLARSGVNAPLALLLIWAALGAWRAPDRTFATMELLRLGTGALIYFALALHLETRAQLDLLIDYLLGLTLLVTVYGFTFQGDDAASGNPLSSVFPVSHHLSAILTVMLPLLASLAWGAREQRRRLAATAAAVWCGAGLLLCLERSSWVAVVVSFLMWLFLFTWCATPSPGRRWLTPLAIATCGMLVTAGLFAVTRAGPFVAARVRSTGKPQDPSFDWRIQKWRGTAVMAAERPVWGWGPGQYVLNQYPYTHIGVPQEEVRRRGPSFNEMAFNEYLQTAAELGLPGLALYLLLLASFFSKAIRALRRLPGGLRRAILLGCIGGVTGQMVDALANGSWRYNECSIFFWLALGLGVAVTRMAYQTPAPSAAGRRPAATRAEPGTPAVVA